MQLAVVVLDVRIKLIGCRIMVSCVETSMSLSGWHPTDSRRFRATSTTVPEKMNTDACVAIVIDRRNCF